ncbi:hypothetical protein SCLCIDRAFT_27135 [Scleroderma citrinum Foug A]|uniref:Uncharacterized protein n=1 Tax=Scleroderma citrinum Foug A TaxID=1036808 RepID=A0A0C2ZD74_9AGAM|nr:hypothetical protein SCLCIDRAFT_27135 [Scleroderma citrinum Foug A]
MVLRKCSNVLPTIQDAAHIAHRVASSSAYESLNDPLPAPNFGVPLQLVSNGMHTPSDAP